MSAPRADPVTEHSVKTPRFAGVRSAADGHPPDMTEHAALLRVAVLCRLLREALYELETEISSSQLAQELTALQERVESELSQSR